MTAIPEDVRERAIAFRREDGCDCEECVELLASLILSEREAAQREERAVLAAEADKLWRMFIATCEGMEDEERGEPQTEHERGFYAGWKFAAKSIRRSVEHPKYNPTDFPAIAAAILQEPKE